VVPTIPELILVASVASSGGLAHTDPLEAALEYSVTMEETAEATEVQEAAQLAAAEEAAEQRAEAAQRPTRSEDRSIPAPSGSLPSLLLTIRANESGGNYGAINSTGCEGYGCYGAYQMHGLYADDWARRYGAASYAGTSPNQWPSGIQDRVALGLFYSTNPDGAHWCNWTDYC